MSKSPIRLNFLVALLLLMVCLTQLLCEGFCFITFYFVMFGCYLLKVWFLIKKGKKDKGVDPNGRGVGEKFEEVA